MQLVQGGLFEGAINQGIAVRHTEIWSKGPISDNILYNRVIFFIAICWFNCKNKDEFMTFEIIIDMRNLELSPIMAESCPNLKFLTFVF